MSPRHGWEDISYDDCNLHKLMIGGLIPWLAIVSLTALLPLYYTDNLAVLPALYAVISTFLMFFVGYYLATAAFSFYMPSLTEGASIENHNNTLILYSIGLLATLEILKNTLPVDLAMLNFFPLYVLYIMWKGDLYLKVTALNQGRYVVLSLLSVIAPPYLMQHLFNLILPI